MPTQPTDLRGRSLAVPLGTVWLDEGLFVRDGERRRLPGLQLRILEVLADGAWHDDAQVLSALGRADAEPVSLHSLVARMRRTLGPCVDRRYGGGWRLQATPQQVAPPDLVELLDVEEPTSPERLCRILQCSRAALRTRIHRLRHLGYPIVHEAGGYRLDDDDNVSVRLHHALKTSPLVVLWGPVGVGTSALAAGQDGRRVHIQNMPRATAKRRLAALASSPPGRLWIDGAGDPRLLLDELRTLVRQGHRVLATARVPLGAEGLGLDVEMPPWSTLRLQRAFPDRDISAYDGLPFASLPLDAQRDHVLGPLHDVPPRWLEAVAQGGPLEEAVQAFATTQGWCVGEPPRVALPVLSVLRSTWTDAQWVQRANALASTLLKRVFTAQGSDAAEPYRQETVALIHELQRRGAPSHPLVSAAFHAGLTDDDLVLQRALETCHDPDRRADLFYARWLVADVEGHDLLRRAIDEAGTEATAHELQVELAYALWPVDRDDALACFRETRAWLDTQDPEDHLWIRSEWLASRVLRDPTAVPLRELVEMITRVERASLVGGEPKARFAWMQLRWALGVAALARDQLGLARRSLEVIVSLRGEHATRRGGIDLLFAHVRAGEWSEAEALWPLLSRADLPRAWDAHRRLARGLWLLALGRQEEARILAETLPTDGPPAILASLLAALRGEATSYGPRPDVSRAVVGVLDGTTPRGALRELPPCRYLSAALVERIVDQVPTPARDAIDDFCNSDDG